MKSVAYESRAVVGKRQPTLTSKKKNGQESGDTIDMNKLKTNTFYGLGSPGKSKATCLPVVGVIGLSRSSPGVAVPLSEAKRTDRTERAGDDERGVEGAEARRDSSRR